MEATDDTDRVLDELAAWDAGALWDAFLRALETPPGGDEG
ncbi:MAG: hypothetical protein KatS3mg043_1119 [Rhodothermaceae bacterium]|nr:MAG: hypothetical protein KatS3mg043_1119 [Rhodothermaceae bacterium]